ncbi:hypothetical protein [Limosilactobacillus sp.]|uniref:hypothetical protein n=1 Tax=Limosilactobacillus sp. TaxID=2773925 RepID=UPI003F0899E3
MDNKQRPLNEEQLSRKEYREQLERQRHHQGTDDSRDDEASELASIGRQQFADDRKEQDAEQKTAVLKRKLNIAIIGLIIAIVIVYLILFYVG